MNRLAKITEKEIALINPENKRLVDEFLMMNEVHLSEKTLKVYASNFNIFFDWLRRTENNKFYKDVTMVDIRKFQIAMKQEGLSGQRINHLKSSLASLSDYIIETYGMTEEWIRFENVPTRVSSLTTEKVKEKVILSEDDVETILDTLIETERIQHAACIALFASSGMRISEVVQARLDWFVGDKVNMLKDDYYITPKIRTKGRGQQGKVISKYVIKPLFDKYLNLWLEERKKLGIDSEHLFVRNINGKWVDATEATIRSWFNTTEKITNIDIHPHSLRHYTATYLRRNDVPIEAIKIILGHEDTKTTEIYIDIDETETLEGSLDFLSKS